MQKNFYAKQQNDSASAMICRCLLIMLLCFLAATTHARAAEMEPTVDNVSATTVSLHEGTDKQQLNKAFDLLIKAFQAGLPEARAGLCKLRAKSYESGNIILVKKIEEHRYLNNYTCDEPNEKPAETVAQPEQVTPAQKASATTIEQAKSTVGSERQRHGAADTAVQAQATAEVARAAAEKQEQERLAALKAKQEKAAEVKAAAEQQKKEKAEQEKAVAGKFVLAQQQKKAEQERLAAETARRAEEKQEREQLVAAIAEEERRITAKSAQEHSAATKTAKTPQEKEHLQQTQSETEAARLAARKREEEHEAAVKKQAAVKAEAERIATKERLAKERADQVRSTAAVPHAPAVKSEAKPAATGAQSAVVTAVATKPESKKQTVLAVPESSRKPGMTKHRPKPGQQVPAFSLVSSSGVPVMPEYYRGSVLVIDFFAPWCQLCRGHIARLTELHNKFKKQGLQVVGLNVDEKGGAAATDFTAELHMFYPIAQADEATQAAFDVRSVPMVYVVDKKGRIAEIFPVLNSETDRAIASLVKKLLLEP